MYNRLLSLLNAVLLILSVNILASCKRFEVNPTKTSPGHSADVLVAAGAGAVEGTSDSGGGTGVSGKVFESYIVKVTDLPAYQQITKNIIMNFQAFDSEKESGDEKSTLENFLSFKTWYIAPVSLAKVNADVLGVSFLRSSTDQIARQTWSEVWIDKVLFDQMSLEEQSDLLLHEIVMATYLIKFATGEDFCRWSLMNQQAGADKSDLSICDKKTMNAFDTTQPAEARRALDAVDNENIRFMTGWIKHNSNRKVSFKEFASVMLAHGFDKRVYGHSQEAKEPREDITLTRQEVMDIFQAAQVTGRIPTECMGMQTKETRPCQIQFHFAQDTFQEMHVRLQVEGFPQVVEATFPLYDSNTLTMNRATSAGEDYALFSSISTKKEIQIGSQIYEGMFFFGRQKDALGGRQMVLQGFSLKPMVATFIDKKQSPSCRTQAPVVQDLQTDSLLMFSPGSNLRQDMLLMLDFYNGSGQCNIF